MIKYKLPQKSSREIPAPIPLHINPADVKKEFDRSPIPTPLPFQDDIEQNGETGRKLPPKSPSYAQSDGGSSQHSTPKQKNERSKKKKEKKKGSKRAYSPDSLNSSSTEKSGKKRKLKKPVLCSMEKSMAQYSSTVKGSVEEGREMFAWIVDPVSMEDFFSTTWEKRPIHITREGTQYYKALFSSANLDTMLRQNCILYGKNLDITSYNNGKRKTLNPVGRANPAEVWDFYKQGCSIRLLNPQTFNSKIWALNAMLQEYFGCFVGANIYLTPPGTQGFAPHYDDIEAFILQLEGKKHWKLYSPKCEEEQLPRFSSDNLDEQEIGDPIMDVVLQSGDLLYFPRGTIHQAKALVDSHSLHITISCYQRNTWGDFIEKVLPAAIEMAIAEDTEMRTGLPRDFLQYLGAAHCEKKASDPRRNEFMSKLHRLMEKVILRAPVDAAADQFGRQLMHDALPPNLVSDEAACSSMTNSCRIEGGKIKEIGTLKINTEIRLVRANILRMLAEEEDDDSDGDKLRIYHCAENSREYHADEPRSILVDAEEVDAVELLIHSYPNYIAIGNLPLGSDKERLDLANKLWKKSLILTSKPLYSGD